MLPFPMPPSVIMACHLTGVYDVNRSATLPDDDYSLVRDWVTSITDLRIKGILFHNSFSEETCARYQTEHVTFVKVAHNPAFNPNVYRYFIYRDFLQQAQQITNVFVTDVSDVVVLNNPFTQPLFTSKPDALFCGDEPKQLDNDWMKSHATHLRSRISDYADYEKKFGQSTLLNCGIIGGNIQLMQSFLEQLCDIHQQYNFDNQTAYTGDMGAFNYLVRSRFNARVYHSSPINTLFKGYEDERTDCWFRHK